MICLKNCTFVVSTTTRWLKEENSYCCDLLEKLYLCGINNNCRLQKVKWLRLWFAWKIVPLWYQQQQIVIIKQLLRGCDLLEKLYLCGINNNSIPTTGGLIGVVICLKNCTFVVSTTTTIAFDYTCAQLWFAWKIVPLWYQQQQPPKDELP